MKIPMSSSGLAVERLMMVMMMKDDDAHSYNIDKAFYTRQVNNDYLTLNITIRKKIDICQLF